MNKLSRECLECGSNKTYVDYSRGYAKYHWYKHKDGYICRNCKFRLFYSPINHLKWNPITNPKWNAIKIVFKDKRVVTETHPRKGICSLCKKSKGDEYINCFGQVAIIKETHMHHLKYHDDDPLKDTMELCASCHTKESWRLRRLNK